MEWQKAFLIKRTQRVKLADTTSDWIEVAGGVPQGTLSGPENILNMIDDLHTDVDDVKFVDDVTLYEACNTHNQNKLQNAVDDIQDWATDNNMSVIRRNGLIILIILELCPTWPVVTTPFDIT